jgi:SAM-dependent methyltransferase
MIELLEHWLDQIPSGLALDLGAGEGHISRWLSEAGFTVEAVEVNPGKFLHLCEAFTNTRVIPIHADIRAFPLGLERYDLVVASSVLHFFKPSELVALAHGLVRSLKPGGWLACEVLTDDDPEYREMASLGLHEIEPKTFSDPDTGVITFFPSGALRNLFAELDTRLYEEYRRISPDAAGGFRAGATLLAMRPPDNPRS